MCKSALHPALDLDSAQTRYFADSYDDRSSDTLIASKNGMLANFRERHAGADEEIDDADQMTILNNPLIDQSMNERFSPFYRLEKMPANVPCLFFHARDDKQVPASQSVDAFNKIRNAGGDTRIVISSQGDHGFFKAGTTYNPDVMVNCFCAIDALVKKPASLIKANINGEGVDSADVEKIVEADKTYKNYKKRLEDFHKDEEVVAGQDGETGMPRKKNYLKKIRDAHQEKVEALLARNIPKTHRNVQIHEKIIASIDSKLEQG